jgi:hypothetical protein
MKKLLILLGFLILCSTIASADYIQTYKIDYDSTTEKSTIFLVGDMQIGSNTTNYISTTTFSPDVILEQHPDFPIKIYNGDLQIVTTGFGITFADGSQQITAGVGSASGISTNGTAIINSDADGSGGDPIIFRTDGAVERMRIISGGNVGIGTATPSAELEVNGDIIISSTTRYYIVPGCNFMPENEDAKWETGNTAAIRNTRLDFVGYFFLSSINLPQNAIVTSVTIIYDRDDASSLLRLFLKRTQISNGTVVNMVDITASDYSGSITTETDSSITSPTIDNNNYIYHAIVDINNNDSITDIFFYGIKITYTITEPLP